MRIKPQTTKQLLREFLRCCYQDGAHGDLRIQTRPLDSLGRFIRPQASYLAFLETVLSPDAIGLISSLRKWFPSDGESKIRKSQSRP